MERTRQKHPFGLPSIGIPAEILFHPHLTTTEKILFGFLQNLSQSEKGCWATNNWLGGLMGVSGQTVSNGIANLQKWGFIYTEYKTQNKVCNRRIFINPGYPQIYREMVIEGHKIIEGGILKNLYPYIRNFIGGYKKFYRGAIRKLIIKVIGKDNNKRNNIPLPEIKNNTDKKEIKLSIDKRNKKYLSVAKYLSSIIQKTKNISHTPVQLKTWSNEIRQLVENNNVDQGRIKQALRWYKKNIGGQYIPVIESGNALRLKFTKLEDAMKREQEPFQNQTNGQAKNPKEIIKQKLPEYYHKTFYNYFMDAEDVIHETGNGAASQLAENMIGLYDWLEKNKAKGQSASGIIIDEFTRWLNQQSWITDKTVNLYLPQSTVFKKFLRSEDIELKKLKYS